jgi:hypothetical protein
MRLTRHLACLLALLVGLSLVTREAHALGPIDLELGAKVGAGSKPESNAPNPYGFGLGGRAGISIFHLYAGGSAIHYFGGSTDTAVGKLDVSSTLLGGELGYTITALPIIQLRPQMGLGSATFSSSLGGTDSSSGHLYLEPGLTVLIPILLLYVGADANALIVPGVDQTSGGTKTLTSLTLHAQVGIVL